MDIEEIANGASCDRHETTPAYPVEESGDQNGLDVSCRSARDKPDHKTGPRDKINGPSTEEF